jgi:protein kinase C substrate 80K-H
VNDDYCDCPDGSDEPGTAACAYISPFSPSTLSDGQIEGDMTLNRTPALPGFYCKNKGHKPFYLPFQRVNDGICDYDRCCDGSDEWAQVGGTKCENRCKEIGKEWKKQEDKRLKSLSTAVKKRKDLVDRASFLRKEVEDRIVDLEVEIQAAEQKIQNMQDDLERLRASERGKLVKGRKKGKVNVLADLAKDRVEELRTALVDVRTQRDQNLARVLELEAILLAFKEDYNPNFNDEGVKRAVRNWEEYAARGIAGNSNDAARDRDLDEISKPDGEDSGINWRLWEEEEGAETEIDLSKFRCSG